MMRIPQVSSESNLSQISTYDDLPSELFFKFILVGDPGVGKTSILNRYIKNKFDQEYRVTVGAEFGSKYVNIDEYSSVKLQIWDTAGQNSFLNVVRSFYHGSQAVFFVYDVTKRKSFADLKKWKADVMESVDPYAILVLMGNQVDKEGRQVSYKEGVEFMQEQGMHFFFETSAKDAFNVDLAFSEAARLAFMSYLKAKLTGKANVFISQRAGISLADTPSDFEKEELPRNNCAC